MDVAPTAPLTSPVLPVERPQGWGAFFKMPVFHPGTQVRFGERVETISHITIRRYDLCIHLVGHEVPVAPEKLELQPSVFATCRLP
ncbi:hypothetical protein [Paracidovorax avenae]|uniref:hypothetical protein n=2 Tax=Paracidovorax avenae TaxID=80867 RepID=UPI000D154EDB|nr:hypothetical protein [Paracidovorax avenae]AVS85028.1 hypothetical protein C8239_09930 [Paracidovorax avenae]AVS88529.1 hypothetical protein C8238_10055 [Paracidovorax avenae]AVS96035.1 hypothetical protein C8232_07045 [Paracidovorax avenae]AVT02733.1 hypothetical protein C8243_09695 [Paracidovorax avenae]AVT06039.1 hypothetical protein C8248_08745 [Paracidovorax avenae]